MSSACTLFAEPGDRLAPAQRRSTNMSTLRQRSAAAVAVVAALAMTGPVSGASAASPTTFSTRLCAAIPGSNLGPTGPNGPLGAKGPLGNTSSLPGGCDASNLGPGGPLGPGGALGGVKPA
jgi:hypothetical protein